MDTPQTLDSLPRRKAPSGRPYLMVIGGTRVGELHALTRERTVVGRSPEAQIRLRDDGISRAHAEILLDGGRLRVRDLGSTNGTFLNGARTDARELSDGDKLSIGEATLMLFTHNDGLEAGYQRGRFLAAVSDPVTSALKRDVFVERLAQEVSFARRHGAPLAVVAWELDGIAALEARLGPAGARQGLAAAARAARGALLDGDVVGLLAPGRFAVACRETDEHAAQDRAARLRAAVAAATFDAGRPEAPLTASVGVVECREGNEKTTPAAAEALLRDAEAALAAALRARP
jgi:diguanylate cyclase (GGDEF)-like protein